MSRASVGLLALALFLITGAGTASAQGRGNAHGGWTQNNDWRGVDGDRDRDEWQNRHRARPDYGVYSGIFGARPSNPPPGWERGRKTGWGNCDLPPGQAKKYGCGASIFGRQRRGSVIYVPRIPTRTRPAYRQFQRRDRDHDRD